MTMTINVPVFPMRKEIEERKQRRGVLFSLFSFPFSKAKPVQTRSGDRYSADALEFDVAAFAARRSGPTSR